MGSKVVLDKGFILFLNLTPNVPMDATFLEFSFTLFDNKNLQWMIFHLYQ